MRKSWDAHKSDCIEQKYGDYENVHLESAAAIELIKQVHERGIVFDTLICDGDNDTVGALNQSGAYQKLDINLKIQKILCLAHVMRNMMKYLFQNQPYPPELKSGPEEIKHMDHKFCGKVAHFYRLALEYHVGDPAGAKTEIDAVPFHLGNDHKLCPNSMNTWCEYYKKTQSPVAPEDSKSYLSEELIIYVQSIFAEHKYIDVDFIKTIRFGISTNINEVLHGSLRKMAVKKSKASFDAFCMSSALSVIQHNDGYSAIPNIFQGFDPNKSFSRTKEAFVKREDKSTKRSKIDTTWVDTSAEDQIREAEHWRKMVKHGPGYSSDKYSMPKVSEEFPSAQEDSDDSSEDF